MKELIINSGSSSLKYQLIDMTNESVIAKGNCEKIGLPTSFLKHKANGKETVFNEKLENHEQAIALVLKTLTSKEYGVLDSLDEIGAVGHRILHGGEVYTDSVLVDDEVIENLKRLSPLGPLHMPANIAGILACKKVMNNVKQVAVFDTAFHSKMPQEAFLYAVPYQAYTDWKIRKYGFHGTSHKFVSMEMAKILGKELNDCKFITVHLGNGSSMAAVKNGHSIDTTMGYTPLEGLMMGTRCGDIDPSVLEVIMEKENISNIHDAIQYLNKKCGILGINGVSPDMRENEEEIAKGNERAMLVPKMLAHRIKKYIGSYMAVLGGVNAIIFTGGIGENDSNLREKCLENLEVFGIEIDKDRNKNLPRGTVEKISTPNSKVLVYRLPTDEELVIARDTQRLAK